MPFSETQLTTWSSQGAITASAATYNSIKTCIDSISWKQDITYEIYLKGSYKNDTNIRGNSDVDVNIEFKSVFYYDVSKLDDNAKQEFDETYSEGKYTLSSFKAAILEKLRSYYGEKNVIDGNKSIKVIGQNGRLDCDVLCCAEYREYKTFSKSRTTNFQQGIVFWTKNNDQIVNFPKQHYDNGVEKNKNCGNYKAVIRIIKNVRSRMVELNQINSKVAPSYFVECLIYNVPDNIFNSNEYRKIIPDLINFLDRSISDGTVNKFICQNYQRWLFGSTDQQWQVRNCTEFVNKLIAFWNAG